LNHADYNRNQHREHHEGELDGRSPRPARGEATATRMRWHMRHGKTLLPFVQVGHCRLRVYCADRLPLKYLVNGSQLTSPTDTYTCTVMSCPVVAVLAFAVPSLTVTVM